ncbi:divergent polysaccharide deacetylase family protein [Marinobacter caseinilyticus]|uniref:divergent polysaccharide deacetylase family protein n=1 Tax=Marinobacter caseinilyticus TaxID=2692195 RepID=UPI00140758B8|nr:divergent polysaccharide deacetylase family protein [Marinobacter caseinilyticus]
MQPALVLITALTLLTTLASAAQPVRAEFSDNTPPPTIAIIIDDMGHDLTQGRRLAMLEQPVTLAFLPYRRHTTTLAEMAHQHHKEIMLHIPMANTRNLGLGAGGLETGMDMLSTIRVLRRALQSIPHVQGVNNHMGSQLTQMQDRMEWVMAELDQYPVYFVDSRTIATTVAGATAEAFRIPTMVRDVFLDHEQTEEYVDAQFKLLVQKARDTGSAIGIGHPHKVTVDYLIKKLPELDEQGIAVATVSALWALRNNNRAMFINGDKEAVSPALAHKR